MCTSQYWHAIAPKSPDGPIKNRTDIIFTFTNIQIYYKVPFSRGGGLNKAKRTTPSSTRVKRIGLKYPAIDEEWRKKMRNGGLQPEIQIGLPVFPIGNIRWEVFTL